MALRSYIKSEAKKKREAGYQSALQAYSHDLRPGLTRPQVENHLRSKGARFTQMCRVDERSALADLVKFGEEDHPLYCSEHYVFVAFEFAGTESQQPFRPYESDVLKRVRIFHQLGGCL